MPTFSHVRILHYPANSRQSDASILQVQATRVFMSEFAACAVSRCNAYESALTTAAGCRKNEFARRTVDISIARILHWQNVVGRPVNF